MTTVRIPLSQPIESRTNSIYKDSRSSNCYFETRDTKREIIKRPGRVSVTLSGTAPSAYSAQGLYAANDYMYLINNNSIFAIDTSNSSSIIGTITGTSAANCSFSQTATVPYTVVHNGTNLYCINGSNTVYTAPKTVSAAVIVSGGTGYTAGDALTVVGGSGTSCELTVTTVAAGVITGVSIAIAGNYRVSPTNPVSVTGGTGSSATFTLTLIDAFIPAGPYAAGLVYLDGYTLLGTTSGRIYNSAVEDPTSWNALDYLTAEAEPDKLVAICKHLNYCVAFGQWSTEFFYDAGNATGSPLARADSYRFEIGCANGFSVVSTDNAVIWVGKSKTHGKSVYVLDGVTPNRISTKYIENYLNADTVDDVTAYMFKISGHMFYVMTMRTQDLTFVYDLNEKQWYHWSTVVIGNPAIVGIAIAGLAVVGTSDSTPIEKYYRSVYGTEFNGKYYTVDDNNGALYEVSTDYYSDSTDPIYFRSVTDIMDAGSTSRKFYPRIEIIGDKVNATMYVNHTDNDYVTWSTFRGINLNKGRAQLWNCGSSRRRAWQFYCIDNVPLRIDACEMDVDIGGKAGEDQAINLQARR